MKYVELNTFLCINNKASSGGEAKHIIQDGKVSVNGEVETRNKKKLVSGDKVSIGEEEFTVTEDVCLKEN